MKIIKSLLSVIALSFALASRAETTNTSSGWSLDFVSASSTIFDHYTSVGAGISLSKTAVVQSDLVLGLKNGFYALFWSSAPLASSWDKDQGTEIDFGVGWAKQLSYFGFGGYFSNCLADLSFVYFDEPKTFSLGAGDILNSSLELSKPINEFARYFIKFENYSTMPGSGFQGGNLYSLGVRVDATLDEWVRLFASPSISYDDGGFGFHEGFVFKVVLRAEFRVAPHIWLMAPYIKYWFCPIVGDPRHGADAVIGGGFRFTF